MIPLQKGLFFSCIIPFRKFTGVIIHLTDRYFGFLCGFMAIILCISNFY